MRFAGKTKQCQADEILYHYETFISHSRHGWRIYSSHAKKFNQIDWPKAVCSNRQQESFIDRQILL